MDEQLTARLPVALVTGFSGSGKTTLIERLIPRLIADGLSVAVIKHDAHGLNVDHPGKDSDRFFRAGATVLAGGPGESFLRSSRPQGVEEAAAHLLRTHDLVLVEGHKHTPAGMKIWLRGEKGEAPPPDAGEITMDLGRDEPRIERVHAFLVQWLKKQWLLAPVRAGILIGGRSSRMGRPKHLLRHGGVTWLERIIAEISGRIGSVVTLGGGDLPPALGGWPHLPDVPDSSGPIAGMRAAMRWDPAASWVFVACDMPLVTKEAISWLLEQRAPGRWAVIPRRNGADRVEPLLAWYDCRAAAAIERAIAPRELAGWRHAFQVEISAELEGAWDNINTARDAARLFPDSGAESAQAPERRAGHDKFNAGEQ